MGMGVSLRNRGHKNDLPTMRLRRASYTLLSKLRKTPRGIKEDCSRIRQAEKDKTTDVFRWQRGYCGAWGLIIK